MRRYNRKFCNEKQLESIAQRNPAGVGETGGVRREESCMSEGPLNR